MMDDLVDLRATIESDAIVIAPDATPLDFLCAVYRDSGQPMSRRLKAAVKAALFVHPKLAVAISIGEADFASRLDKAIDRSRLARQGQLIEAKALPPAGPAPTPLGAPMARLRRV
jgi:hypothetical protein